MILKWINIKGREFRAQRDAEQKPCDHQFYVFKKYERGVSMVKNVLSKAGIHMGTALATLGWLSFLVSFLINNPIWKIVLKAIARVLP